MEVNDVVNHDRSFSLIFGKQDFHAWCSIFWLCSFRGILCTLLQNAVEFFDDILGKRFFRHINTKVNGPKMIDSFDNVINRDTLSDIYCVCFKNQPDLLFTELTALYAIGIVKVPL